MNPKHDFTAVAYQPPPASRYINPAAGPGTLGPGLFESRLRTYDEALATSGVTPLTGKRILDLGCGNGKWLGICCERWSAREEDCFGVDLRAEQMEKWRRDNPQSRITLLTGRVEEVGFEPQSFDLIHQSMLLSSVNDQTIRDQVARDVWTRLRPGGWIVSYDFWINPVNPRTIGIGTRELRRLFPDARTTFYKTITVAPPLARLVYPMSEGLLLGLERLRFLNTHVLVVLNKPA